MLNIILSLIVKVSAMGSPLVETFEPSKYCFLMTEINFDTANDTVDCLRATGNKLYMNSPGGIVPAGEIIMEYVKANNVTVFCDNCFSMAANIWLNAPKREIHANSMFMMHYIWCMWVGPATIEDLRQQADRMEHDTEKFLDVLSSYQKNYFIKKMKKGDFYFNRKALDLIDIKYTVMVKNEDK